MVEAFGLDVLDHLNKGGSIEAAQAGVAINKCALEQLDPGSRPFGLALQAAIGARQRDARYLDADDPGELFVFDEPADQFAFAAAQIENAGGAQLLQRLSHRVEAAVVQAWGLFDDFFGRILALGVEDGFGFSVLVLREPGKGLAHEAAPLNSG